MNKILTLMLVLAVATAVAAQTPTREQQGGVYYAYPSPPPIDLTPPSTSRTTAATVRAGCPPTTATSG